MLQFIIHILYSIVLELVGKNTKVVDWIKKIELNKFI